MVPVGRVGSATVVGSGRTPREAPAAQAGEPSAQRALVRIIARGRSGKRRFAPRP